MINQHIGTSNDENLINSIAIPYTYLFTLNKPESKKQVIFNQISSLQSHGSMIPDQEQDMEMPSDASIPYM